MAQPPPPVFGFPFVSGMMLTNAAIDFLTKLWDLATEGVVLPFYGRFPGVPGNSAVLASWLMTGAEQFAAGLPDTVGLLAVAPTTDWTATITVTGLVAGTSVVGTASVPAGGSAITWQLSQDYDASAYDILSLVGPAVADATAAGIYATLVATLA